MKARFVFSTLALCALILSITNLASAKPVSHTRTVSNIDWTSAGIAGVGGGSGTITLTTIKGIGVVKQAFLYWHGINNTGIGAVYDNPNIIFAGHPITGVAIGDAGTNCWGAGSSRAFEADVTPFVTGNGSFPVSGLASQPGYSPNGVSLVVIYDDGDPTNNRDLVFFVGNDSNFPENFPGEDPAGTQPWLPSTITAALFAPNFMLPMARIFLMTAWSSAPRTGPKPLSTLQPYRTAILSLQPAPVGHRTVGFGTFIMST